MSSATPISRSAVSPLMHGFSGSLLLPGDDGYETARRVHNGMIDRHPSVIARCAGTTDVVNTLDFAVKHGLEIAVRGGGHNVAGRAVCNDGMMLDLSAMKGTQVDPRARTIRVQAGVTWAELNRETQLHGLATTGGAVSSTGVAGLTLGGGFGFLMGKHGFTVDNLTSVELVTAKGEVLQVSNELKSDLFWGLRGGGGNFGVATSFEFALHPVGPEVHGGMIAYPFGQSKEVLSYYRDLTSQPADDLTVAAGLTHSADGSGQKLAAMLVCHCGAADEATAALHPIKAFGTPALDRLGQISYTSLNQMLDASFPKLARNYWKSCLLGELSDDVIAVLREQFARCPSPMSKLILEHFHGAVLRPKPTDTAFPHRDPGYSVLIIAQWLDPKDDPQNIAWAKETFAMLAPFARHGAYSNYMADDEPLAGVKRAFAENFPRLQKLKDLYDPGNLFRNNQNIPPSKQNKGHYMVDATLSCDGDRRSISSIYPCIKGAGMDNHDFMKGRKASRIVWHQAHEIAGQKGRSIDAALFAGQVTFVSGERGTYIGCEVVGTTKDPEAFSGNAIILLNDGSVSTQTFEGRSETANGPDRFAGTGTWRMESGTGRFAGLRGSGPFRWSIIGDEYEEEFSG